MTPSHPDPIILKAIQRHVESPGRDLPQKLTLALGDFYLDLCQRIADLTGCSKTEVIRRSLGLWVTDETLDLLYEPDVEH
tara:strand:- start:1954 stop:2193 length:240 start_codon:yes stop_codon:yes gene_type:complete